MNKRAIYNFVKKINTATNEKEFANLVNQGLLEITKASACWIGLANWETNKIEINKLKTTEEYRKNKKLALDIKK